MGGGHIGPFQGVILQVLKIKKISQCIVSIVNLSVLKLEKRYLHQNWVQFKQKPGKSKHTPGKSNILLSISMTHGKWFT